MLEAKIDSIMLNSVRENISKTDTDIIPALMDTTHLPGPLCVNKLSKYGAINQLTSQSGYSFQHANSVIGRSEIIMKILHNKGTICLFTAAWIWIGGDFPENIDIIAYSNYRRKTHDRSIRMFHRKISAKECNTVGKLHITTPIRTVCDIAFTPSESPQEELFRQQTVHILMEQYGIRFYDCLHIFQENPYFPGASMAKIWLKKVMQDDYEINTKKQVLGVKICRKHKI